MAPDAAAALCCAAAKALTQLSTVTAKAPALLSLSPGRRRSSSAGHTVYEGPSPLYPTPYFGVYRGCSPFIPRYIESPHPPCPEKGQNWASPGCSSRRGVQDQCQGSWRPGTRNLPLSCLNKARPLERAEGAPLPPAPQIPPLLQRRQVEQEAQPHLEAKPWPGCAGWGEAAGARDRGLELFRIWSRCSSPAHFWAPTQPGNRCTEALSGDGGSGREPVLGLLCPRTVPASRGRAEAGSAWPGPDPAKV